MARRKSGKRKGYKHKRIVNISVSQSEIARLNRLEHTGFPSTRRFNKIMRKIRRKRIRRSRKTFKQLKSSGKIHKAYKTLIKRKHLKIQRKRPGVIGG